MKLVWEWKKLELETYVVTADPNKKFDSVGLGYIIY